MSWPAEPWFEDLPERERELVQVFGLLKSAELHPNRPKWFVLYKVRTRTRILKPWAEPIVRPAEWQTWTAKPATELFEPANKQTDMCLKWSKVDLNWSGQTKQRRATSQIWTKLSQSNQAKLSQLSKPAKPRKLI